MKKFASASFLILFVLLSGLRALADGHNISITIKGLENSFYTLAYHLGEKQYITDTVKTDASGKGTFAGPEKFNQGIYLVLMPDNEYFDLIIGSDQNFKISCSIENLLGTMKVIGSEDNKNFVEYQLKWRALQNITSQLQERLKANSENNDSTKVLYAMLNENEDKMKDLIITTATKSPGSLLSSLVKALLPLDIPEFDIPENQSNPDSLKWILAYNYSVEHYFDHIDLSDPRMLKTPIIHGKLKNYFSDVLLQDPDTIIKWIPKIVAMSKADTTMFRFVVVSIYNHFRESNIMGHDAVMVQIIEDYYLSKQANWISEETYQNLWEDVERLKPNLIGKKAKNLILNTYNQVPQSLYDIPNKYTILYFWEPDCGHCKTSTPLLKEIYEKTARADFEIFAIYTQSEKDKWESYIAENELTWINGWDPERSSHFDFYYNVNATPLVYILDNNKKIIAKKISVENIEDFISKYEMLYETK